MPMLLHAQTEIEKEFQMIERIGRGSYGAVYKALHRTTGQIVALKKQKIDGDLFEVQQEVDIMAKTNNKHLVNFLGSKLKTHLEDGLEIAMEFCTAGSVDNIMLVLDYTFTEPEISYIIEHALRMIHRDIKPGNILIGDDLNIKLGDFGVSGQMSATQTSRNTMTGTPYYIAPEILDESAVGYREGVDVWSLGITAIELADGVPPLSDIEPMRVLQVIAHKPPPTLEDPARWSDEFNDFLRQCLVKEPTQRPSAGELLKHPFIAQEKSNESLRALIEESTHLFKEGGGVEKTVNVLAPPEQGLDMETVPLGFSRAPPGSDRLPPPPPPPPSPPASHLPLPPPPPPEMTAAPGEEKRERALLKEDAIEKKPTGSPKEVGNSALLSQKEKKKAERERKKQEKLAEKKRKKAEKLSAKVKGKKGSEPTEEEILSILYQS